MNRKYAMEKTDRRKIPLVIAKCKANSRQKIPVEQNSQPSTTEDKHNDLIDEGLRLKRQEQGMDSYQNLAQFSLEQRTSKIQLDLKSKNRASEMTTFQLMSNSNTLLAGIGLLTQLHTKKLNAKEIGTRLGVNPNTTEENPAETEPENMPRRKRTANRKVLLVTAKSKANSREKIPIEQNSQPSTKDDEYIDLDDEGLRLKSQQEEGEVNLRELVNRSKGSQLETACGEEVGELKLKSFGVESFIPFYKEKKQMLDIHAKNIVKLKTKALKKLFKLIVPQIQQIFDGEVSSERQTLYFEGRTKKQQLKEFNVSVPFDNDQGISLFSLLFDLLVPDLKERPIWTDYINFVMLPESFVRIYAHVNSISYEAANMEMRFGACYDGPLLH